ncbi:MAG: hypothetical protein JKY95_14730 [Planctomycetaceae bacterium]|nr:hypothetical protein [Planctomycetaceae bacterium]
MRLTLLTAICLICFCSSRLILAVEVQSLSILEFVAIEDEWGSLVGKPLRIEGRYSSFSPTSMRFKNCSLPFLLPPRSVRPDRRIKTMEVNGTLKKEKTELVFQVSSFRLLQTDQDIAFRRKRLLPKNNPVPWYELGKKTIRRGEFYEDQLLQQLGSEILLGGIHLEKKLQKERTPEFLLSLAAKAATLGLADRDRIILIFESCQLQFRVALTTSNYDFSKLRNHMEKQLPGSTIPLTSLRGVIFDQFRKNPLSTYEQATDHARRQISRLFYLQVVQEEYQRRLNQKGSNGDSIASSYEKIAPDDPETTKSFREQALMFRSKNIVSARRNEVLDVAKQYREQKKEQMAMTVLKTWLNHRTSQLDRAGPSDYLTTALDFEQWFSDQKKAEELLLLGIKRFPEDEAIGAELAKRNYVLQKDEWVSRSILPVTKLSKIELAMQNGRIVVGMTREQVASSLGGPKTASRITSKRQTVLIWNYPDSRLAIRFTQRQNAGNYVVVAVDALSVQ